MLPTPVFPNQLRSSTACAAHPYTCNTPVTSRQQHTVGVLDEEQVRYMFVCGRPGSGTPNRHVCERGRAGARWMVDIPCSGSHGPIRILVFGIEIGMPLPVKQGASATDCL